jgi:hypothetical protein
VELTLQPRIFGSKIRIIRWTLHLSMRKNCSDNRGHLFNPTNPTLAETQSRDLPPAARTLGLQLHILKASTTWHVLLRTS